MTMELPQSRDLYSALDNSKNRNVHGWRYRSCPPSPDVPRCDGRNLEQTTIPSRRAGPRIGNFAMSPANFRRLQNTVGCFQSNASASKQQSIILHASGQSTSTP